MTGTSLLAMALGIAVAATGPAQAQQPGEPQALANVNAAIEQRAGSGGPAHQVARIGPGDLLNIRVFQVSDLSGEYTVEHDGTLTLPFVGEKIMAAGKAPTELAQEIEILLKKRELVNDPQVVVLVKEHHSGPVAVVGAVRQPTVFQASHPIRLLGALARAGGLAADAGNVVVIRRGARGAPAADPERTLQVPGDAITSIDLRRLVSGEDPSLDVPVFGGDTITVPPAGIVYVLGAVRRPGGFALRNGDEQMTALKALALAEDLQPAARPSRAAIIRKGAPDAAEQTISVDLAKVRAGKAPNPTLLANDILFIPDSSGKKAMLRAAEAAIQMTTGLVIWRR